MTDTATTDGKGNAIEVAGLCKRFFVRETGSGARGTIRALLRPDVRPVVALDRLTFSIERGERVAFVGPNGAGKSTTLKILSGILHPDAGRVRVLGLDPARERRRLGYRIGTVFGQRSQLWYHLPAADTFALLARIYDQDDATHRGRLAAYVEAFGLGALLDKPVRQLSLGQRMRCEIVASLLHAPEILFLDEPTIGLDVTAKAVIRDLVREQSERDGRTLLFTSHDTGDMEKVCNRVIVIHHGRVLLDQSTEELRKGFIARKRVIVHSQAERIEIALPGVRARNVKSHTTELDVDLAATSVERVVQALLAQTSIADLSIEDPPMEEIIRAIYAGAATGPDGEERPWAS